MKLFYVVGGTRARSNMAFSHKHVHANSAAEARSVAYERLDMPPVVHVYDLSQDALCPGRLDLEKVPREEFLIP